MGPPKCQSTRVFVDVSPAARADNAAAGGKNLLGRYDVACVRVCADFDREWAFIPGVRNDFWVAHAAAVNIGESTSAPDFNSFCRQGNKAGEASGRLDEERYYEAMGQIADN